MKTMSRRQQQTFNFIQAYIALIGRPPSQLEISRHLGIHPSGAAKHLRRMERKGYIYCKPFKHRGIQILERTA